MSPLLPESGSVALTVRMTLPAGVCSGSSTWKRRKPQSESGSPLPRAPSIAGRGGLGLARQPKPRSSSLSLARETTGKGSVLLDPSRAPQPLAWASALQHTLPKAAFNRDLPRSRHNICLGRGSFPTSTGLPIVLIHFCWTLCIQLCPLQGLVPGSLAWFQLLLCHSDSMRNARMRMWVRKQDQKGFRPIFWFVRAGRPGRSCRRLAWDGPCWLAHLVHVPGRKPG